MILRVIGALVFAGLLGYLGFNSNLNSSDNIITHKFSEGDSLKNKDNNMDDKVVKSEEEWKNSLTPEQYRVLREKGTERAFTGEYWDHFEEGVYKCAGCGAELFASDTKFDSHCGWPSYFSPLAGDRVVYKEDRSFGMVRTEVLCAKCGGHLGHVFEDGPDPTGLRYCINSVSILFEKRMKDK